MSWKFLSLQIRLPRNDMYNMQLDTDLTVGNDMSFSLQVPRYYSTQSFSHESRLFWNYQNWPSWSQQQLGRYLSHNVNYDHSYADQRFPASRVHRLINDTHLDERTVAKQSRMGKGIGSFQIGTNHIHGCTVITIISNRAVWMAHFWEADLGEEDWEILFQNMPFFIEEFRQVFFFVPFTTSLFPCFSYRRPLNDTPGVGIERR